MRKILFVATLAIGLKYSILVTSPTPPVEQRLKILKWQLKEEIAEKQKEFSVIPPEDDLDILDGATKTHMRSRNALITPVSRQKKKRLGGRHIKQNTTISTTGTTTPVLDTMLRDTVNNLTDSDNSTEDTGTGLQLRMQQMKAQAKKWAKHVKKYGSPVEIFYRRDSEPAANEAEIWQRHLLHCADLLRPILTGMKKNITQQKVVGEHIADRLIQLLSYGGGGQTPDEIRAILLQINNLQIRFFQWEVKAIKKLFNFIMPSQKHSFKYLKYGVKRILLHVWKMDLRNTNQLIKESRMFRPPCVGSSKGSTISSKVTRFTTQSKPRSTCAPKDKKCLEWEQTQGDEDDDK